jgi:tetratricopeptide (TPR) repeat protein
MIADPPAAMSRESLIFGVAGAFFGFLIGWMVGSTQAPGRAARAPVRAESAAEPQQPSPPALDEARVQGLEQQAERAPADAAVRAELGNLYFDAEHYDRAIRWYEEALRIQPRNVEVSTDLGVCYYYTNQADRALAQFDRSLKIDPRHAKTILNVGIVRAFGKQDLAGAVEAWERVIALAPDSPEARAAKQAIERVKSAHPGVSEN